MTQDSLTLFYHPQSRAVIVHWLLEELAVPYAIKLVDLQRGEQKTPDFLRINPMGKLPTLQWRGTTVTEAAAICTFLADLFPTAKLAPPVHSSERATYLRWMFFAAATLEQALSDRAFPRAAPPRASSIGYGTYENTLATLHTALRSGPFVLGETFSAVDIYLGSQIQYALMFKTMDPDNELQAYVNRCTARPAYQRVRAEADRYVQQLKGV